MPRKAGTKDSDMVKKAQYTVVVSPDIRAFFQSAVINGTGGFQSLGRILQDQLKDGNVLVMDEQLFRRVVRTAEHYGDGGFQTKLRKIAIQWLDQNFAKVAKAFNG
jgi:precorrin-6B methylase 2